MGPDLRHLSYNHIMVFLVRYSKESNSYWSVLQIKPILDPCKPYCQWGTAIGTPIMNKN